MCVGALYTCVCVCVCVIVFAVSLHEVLVIVSGWGKLLGVQLVEGGNLF